MSFVYRVVLITCSSKSLVNYLSETINIYRENCIKLTFSGCPRKFYHSYVHSSL